MSNIQTTKKSNFLVRWWDNLTPNNKLGLKVFAGIMALGAIAAATVVTLGATGVIAAGSVAGLSTTGAGFGAIGTWLGFSAGSAAVTAGAAISGVAVTTGAVLAGGFSSVVSDIRDGNPEKDLRNKLNTEIAKNKQQTLKNELDKAKPRLLEAAKIQGDKMGEKRAQEVVRNMENKVNKAGVSGPNKITQNARKAATGISGAFKKAANTVSGATKFAKGAVKGSKSSKSSIAKLPAATEVKNSPATAQVSFAEIVNDKNIPVATVAKAR